MTGPRTDRTPTTYRVVPDGYTQGSATYAELQAAGFHVGVRADHKRGTAPLDEIAVDGTRVAMGPTEAATILAGSSFRVLRASDGVIVATWDEGRWWTPEESDAFTRALVAEMQAQTPRRSS